MSTIEKNNIISKYTNQYRNGKISNGDIWVFMLNHVKPKKPLAIYEEFNMWRNVMKDKNKNNQKRVEPINACTNENSNKADDMNKLSIRLLEIDFEQTFTVHEDYKRFQIDLLKLSLQVLSIPILVAAALISANIIASTEIKSFLSIELIWYSMFISGMLNFIVVRMFITTDKVQTEAKHHINKLRGIYLYFLKDSLPTSWEPEWKNKNKGLDKKFKLKGANLLAITFSFIDSLYVASSIYLMHIFKEVVDIYISAAIGIAIWFLHQDFFVKIINRFINKIGNRVLKKSELKG